jgi:hypothetical protein
MSRDGNGPEVPSRTEAVVATQPFARCLATGPVHRTGQVHSQIAHRSHRRVVLDERPVLLQRLLQLGGLVRRPEPTPGDQVCAGCDSGRRVDLQECQQADDHEQVGWPLGVQDMGANRNRPRLRTIEAVDAHDAPA